MARNMDRFTVAFPVSADLLALPARGQLQIWRTRVEGDQMIIELSLRADRDGAKRAELRAWREGAPDGHVLTSQSLPPTEGLTIGGSWSTHVDGGTLELLVNSRVVTSRTGVLACAPEPVVTGADFLALLLAEG